MHRTLSLTTGLAVLLSACASPTTLLPTRPPGQPVPTPQQTRFEYNCDNGESVALRFFPQQGVAVLERGGQNVELTQQSGTSTFSNGQTTVKAGPDRTTIQLQVGMMATTTCGGRQVEVLPPMQPAPPAPLPVPPPAPLPPPAPAEMRVTYRCDNDEQVTVRYFPQQGVAVLVRGGQNTELAQQRTPPGFTYSGGPTTLRVSEDRLSMTMQIGMMANTSCRAA
jgi:hypothetical protein